MRFNSLQTKPKDSVTTEFRASESEKPTTRFEAIFLTPWLVESLNLRAPPSRYYTLRVLLSHLVIIIPVSYNW